MAEGTVKAAGFKGIVYWICIVASLGGLLFGLDQELFPPECNKNHTP
jgi:hypothetical protein